jgi:hypothetical protein
MFDSFSRIESQVGFAFLFVRPVARVTIGGQDGTNIAIEVYVVRDGEGATSSRDNEE